MDENWRDDPLENTPIIRGYEPKKPKFRPTLMDDKLTGVITQLRRLYLHLLSGESITADDLSWVIKRLEEINK